MGYGCRICQATAFRRLRAGEGEAGSLYACTGCGAVFTSPDRWRRMVTHQAAPMVAPVVALDESRQALAMRTIGDGGGWTSMPRDPDAFGSSPEDVAAIKEAAARANRSKKRR